MFFYVFYLQSNVFNIYDTAISVITTTYVQLFRSWWNSQSDPGAICRSLSGHHVAVTASQEVSTAAAEPVSAVDHGLQKCCRATAAGTQLLPVMLTFLHIHITPVFLSV